MSEAIDAFRRKVRKKEPDTQKTYWGALRRYLTYRGLQEEQAEELLKGEARRIEDDLATYIKKLVNDGKSYSSQSIFYSAIMMFYEANRIPLTWGWIADHMEGQADDGKGGRAYDQGEIVILHRAAEIDEQTAMGVMYSGGPRVGALAPIRIRHLKFFEQYKTYCLKYYILGDVEEGWDRIISKRFTFVTPQVSKYIDELAGGRGPNDFLFVNKHDASQGVTTEAIRKRITALARKVGLRDIGSAYERKAVQIDHGFRKFFDTQVQHAGVDDLYRKFMMDHSLGLDDHYFKPLPEEVFEGSAYRKGYNVAIPRLTIKF